MQIICRETIAYARELVFGDEWDGTPNADTEAVRLRLRLGQLPPEYLRLPALIHEGLTQQMPDYAAAAWRLEGMLGRELSGHWMRRPAWRHTPRWGCRERGKKSRVYHKISPVMALRRPPTKEIRLNAFSYLLLEEIRRVNRPAGSR